MLHHTPEHLRRLRHLDLVASNEAHCERNARIRARAEELVSKTMPRRTGPVHGFYSFREGIERAAYKGRRDKLIAQTIADLHAQGFGYDAWDADYAAAVERLTARAA